jgi:Chitobiase/beta-hexosaminidase C-terminal domain
VPPCLLFLAAAGSLFAQAPNVLTWRYDNTHQGQNTQETILTPANVNTNTFGKLFSHTVDGQVYAQPLYVANLTVNNATHNVIFIADEHDSVYAFDADSNGGADSGPLWQASMLSTAHGATSGATTVPSSDVQTGTGDINPEIGISSTPVIDINTQTLFVVAKTKENGSYVQRLHALSILDGSERSGSPVAISASVTGNGNGSSGGKLTFSTLWQLNRPALGLFNGSIYIAFGSHGDNGPWHGWVLVYNETTLKQTAAVSQSPNGDGNGIWMSGAGLPIDTVSANGRAFLATGNGDLTTYPPLTNNVDYGESVLRYDLANGGFAISDAFTDYNQSALTGADLDQGSGGVLILPDQPGAHTHLLIQIGKEGRILVLDRDGLGGYVGPNAGSNTNAVQDITGALGVNTGLWSTPAYWNGNVYMWAESDALKMIPITSGVLAKKATAQSSVTSLFPGATPVVSSNGTTNGIVWALLTSGYKTNGDSILYAFNAGNVAQELYSSSQNPSRDNAGLAVKFTVPVITNGKVYVGANGQVDVYGLLNAQQQAPAPVISPAGGTYSGSQQVTITDTVSGAAIYYTTDGSAPTASSTRYAGAFPLAADATVQAIASASGYLQSAVASATFNFNTQTPMPQFSPATGTYTTTQSVTISDSTSGAVIYYTTNGSTPTTSSTKYTGPISVNSSTVINAIATLSGLTNSNLATASYTIQPNGTEINYGSGFSSVAGLTLNGSATNVDDSRLQLTTDLTFQAASVFYNTPVNITSFTTDFAFQLSNALADGFTFTIQNVGPTVMGGDGGSLGYGPNPNTGTTGGIAKSVAVKFDFYNNNGEGTDSTGLYLNGAAPTVPAVDMTSSGVLLNSGDTITAHMTYDGVNLIMTLTDIVVNKTFTHTFPIKIPATIGSSLAYIGFTGGSGGESSSQKILSWTLTSQSESVTQTPVLSPAGGSFAAAQQVSLSDGTAGAVIYYTIDGSVPTTSSTVYGSPISVDTGTVTIKAIAQAPGLTASSVGSETYIIQLASAATPAFSPGTGTYTSAQSITLSDATPGATIYYTTNGTPPTTSSAVYSSAIAVTANTTLEALAIAPGFAQSLVASAAYVIQSGGAGNINFAGGFPNATGLQLNSLAKVNNNFLELTDGGTFEGTSAFWTTPVNIQAFTTNFSFQLSTASADGFTFTVQGVGPTALGGDGGSLGYGPNPNTGATGGIARSVAIKFDIYSNSGEGADSAGLFINGGPPTTPAIDLTSSGIVLSSGDTISAQLVYNGTTLTLSLTDTVTKKTFSHAFTVNIPSTVGGNTGYVGFTGGTGGSTAIQNIQTWAFTSGTMQVAADPIFSPLPGTYTSAQDVSLSSATTGATIYYTVDGSTPTHSSTVYSGPIVVNGTSLTIRAFASATGYQDSPVVVGTYQIQAAATPAAIPAFTPASGTSFSSTLSVTITDTTVGAAIHYTTDGSTPTPSSQLYSSPFTISATTTVKAIATGNGFTPSAQGSASYTGSTGTSGAPLSDEFNAGSLNASVWQVNTPVGGSVAVSNGELVLTVPAGSNHDAAVPALDAVQVIQPISNTNFDVAVKIDSALLAATRYYGQGLMVEGDAKDYIRFELSAGGTVNLSAGTVIAGAQTTKVQISPFTSYAVPTYLRLTRVGNNYTAYWSTNGTAWNQAGTFADSLVVTGVAPYAWNYSTTPSQAPALTATFDWFHNMATSGVPAAAPPTYTPASGTSFTSTLSVSIADTTPSASIYYTTDGSTPTTSSQLFANPFTISASTTVHAMAIASGYTQSAQGSADYTYSPVTSGTPVSDEFGAVSLNTAVWQVIAPVGGSAAVSNGELVLTVPGGSNHDAAVPALDAVQVIQPISNTNFDVAVKIDSSLVAATQYYGQGLMVEGDAKDYIRFEVSAGGTVNLGLGTVTGGISASKFQIKPFSAYAVPTYLRMTRVGTTFTAYWSADGVTWNEVGAFSDNLVVTGLAPYAWNYSLIPSQAPALTATFDWFHNLTAGP